MVTITKVDQSHGQAHQQSLPQSHRQHSLTES